MLDAVGGWDGEGLFLVFQDLWVLARLPYFSPDF